MRVQVHNKDHRTLSLCQAFGWQGGTIHQVAKRTGCESTDILYADSNETNNDYLNGFVCGLHGLPVNEEWRLGNVQFWIGVADGSRTRLLSKERKANAGD